MKLNIKAVAIIAGSLVVGGLGRSDVLETPEMGQRIVSIGGALGERMLYYPHFETALHMRFPESVVEYYNMCRSGDTPGLRPHASRFSQWAFPGAEQFHPDTLTHLGEGHFPEPDVWLETFEADVILGFFGYAESFGGEKGLPLFRSELEAFIEHTLSQRYNGDSKPVLVLVSPIAFEDLSLTKSLPKGEVQNRNLALYAREMESVAQSKGIGFVDLFQPTQKLFSSPKSDYTINGHLPNDAGYQEISRLLMGALFGSGKARSSASYEEVYEAIEEKNWSWSNDYHVLNGVHVYGRRYKPFGDKNYPEEIEKIRQMTDRRMHALHQLVKTGRAVEIDDRSTRALSEIETNYELPIEFLSPEESMDRMTLPDGYEVGLFASEREFPDLGSPVQMSFDNKGRLWVAVIPSYPHYRPGDGKPNDKILILEDTDGDGKADKQTVFADGLHMPIGFELAEEGVYLAQQPNLVLLVDEDGDDRADRMEYLLHGFDSHDTHHSISAFSAGPEGSLYMAEGRFLHSQVETPYGVERMTDGGVWRFNPRTWKLSRVMQTDVSNPWGITFNEWGDLFLADASGGSNWWGLPLSAKAPHAYEIEKVEQFTTVRVRPTLGAEFVSSRHFPDQVQGDFLINNTIGFLGTKQHTMEVEEENGYTGELRFDLISSQDPNFRPVDMEFAPDGSLYLVDWHNPLIGHMQHSARDPNRDKAHGRVYRLTYPSRSFLKPAAVEGATIEALLENLTQPEYRTRYRSRRELRGRFPDDVAAGVEAWLSKLRVSDSNYERTLLEALWVEQGVERVDQELLERCLRSPDYRVRTAATLVLGDEYAKMDKAASLLLAAAKDPNTRVRLAAISVATWVGGEAGAEAIVAVLSQDLTRWMKPNLNAALLGMPEEIREYALLARDKEELRPDAVEYAINGKPFTVGAKPLPITNMAAKDVKLFELGKEVYHRDGYCATCHGEDGKGAIEGIYPPLVNSEWVRGSDERLIKLVLKGLTGKIEVGGKVYDPANGVPPMTAFEQLLSDEEIAAVLTYVRVAIADRKALSSPISEEQVKAVREKTREKTGFYDVEELLREHPME